ncbi:late control protein D [Clostridium taeniosporum]|uniref:late control protein D n=1 Tax=Clostridium taeniosporum TaxID=394958 RepID=UPI000F7445F1|nr:late control protein D [Clostridium taeniosporum]
MEAIRKLKVECPYEILKIEDAKIFCKPNEHGSIYLKCLIDDSVNFKYSIEASTNDKICVYEEIEENTDLSNNENTGNEEKRIIIFNGIIENVKTTNINGIYYLELEGSSTSSLLDMEKRTRSFQDINMSYDDLINEILKNYKGYGFTQCMSQPMSIEKPLFQYKETDYEFLKRIGSHLGLEIICDVVNTNNIIYFGKPSLKFHALNNEINYKAHKDLEKYHKVLALGMDLHDTDFFYYEVILREKMNIGDLIKFKERDFYVNQYYGQIHNRELIYKYRLCRKKGIWQEKIYNEKLKGISIEGKVLAVDGEKVKLHLNIDESQEISKASWFKYAPPTGNIMYAMPIVGESVMLYFPNKYDEPIVTGCVRKNGSSCSKISNTNNRYFSTESGNNLDILPGAINFYRSGMNVNLNDENGINISSSGNLSLGASGGISLSGGSVSISGSNKVVVQKSKSSYISLEGECYNQSNEVYENGSCRETYEPFTDDDPQNGVAEALAEQMKMNEAALLAATDGANAVSSSTDDSKTDGTLDIAVDDYGKFAEDGEEAYKKAKPTEQLVGSVVADECVELIIEPLKWIPMGARWFGEKTGLGDENTYKNNTECIERLTELQEGVHKFFKNLSGDERTFEGISAIYENALAVSGGISLIIGATKGSIALSKSKK